MKGYQIWRMEDLQQKSLLNQSQYLLVSSALQNMKNLKMQVTFNVIWKFYPNHTAIHPFICSFAEGSCHYHSGVLKGAGWSYEYTCCSKSSEDYNAAKTIAGCTKGKHCSQHHTKYQYSAYVFYMQDQVYKTAIIIYFYLLFYILYNS